jgi:phosphonoacetaldehyde hydrolase
MAERRIRAVIFDWSGTIIDHGCVAPAVAFVELFRRWEIDVTVAEARGPMGTYKRDHIRSLLALPAVERQWQALHGRPGTEADVDAMYEQFVPIQMNVIEKYSTLIPGVVEAAEALRARGIKLGSSTGYFEGAANASVVAAGAQGLHLDAMVCATDVPAGRPAPWMVFRNLEEIGVYPPSAVVKVGDTPVDIEEGLNAGAWSIGVSRTGNEIGLTEAELAALAPEDRRARVAAAAKRLRDAGAHAIIESVTDLAPAIEAIEERVARGECP